MTPLDYAAKYIEDYGWHLVPIPYGSKAPVTNDWGDRTITSYSEALRAFSRPSNVGLALGPSGMVSLDIDSERHFGAILDELGLSDDEREEIHTFPTIRGRGRKILWRAPEANLSLRQLSWANETDPTGELRRKLAKELRNASSKEEEREIRGEMKALKRPMIFELRGSTDCSRQLQDVLPPSLHPDTQRPYEWVVEPPERIEDWPEPPAWVMYLWEHWDELKDRLEKACPWWKPSRPAFTPVRAVAIDSNESVIDRYNRETSIHDELLRHGYRKRGRRYVAPTASDDKDPGVNVDEQNNRCYSHHGSDAISNQPLSPFDLFCYYEHNGNRSAAVKELAEKYGMSRKSKPAAPAPTAPPMAKKQTPLAPQRPIFKPLGFNGENYYYMSSATSQVEVIRRGAHTSASDMLSLAPLGWWLGRFPNDKQTRVEWQAAASWCMQQCHNVGVYSTEDARGRGAWFDLGRSVVHLGDRLIVDGQETSLFDFESNYVYTRRPRVEYHTNAQPLDDETCQKIAALYTRLNWQKADYAKLAAGWAALSPACGAFAWRPHIWVDGPSGSGKTWVLNNMIMPIPGRMALSVQGKSSEAGLRQFYEGDALPVVFDESEAENQKTRDIIQGVIELARGASSENAAPTLKGSANGKATLYKTRSMFCLGSINTALSQTADETRFTVLRLFRAEDPNATERFKALEEDVARLMSPENCGRLRVRIYSMIPTIRANAQKLSDVIATLKGKKRIGDQLGALLAGWWALHSQELLTDLQAEQIINEFDFSDAMEVASVPDERKCLDLILQAQLDTSGTMGPRRAAVGELIQKAAGRSVDHLEHMNPDDADGILRRHGMRVEGGVLYMANQHSELSRILKDSPWGIGHREVLARVTGAFKAGVIRYAGFTSRSLGIPLDSLCERPA